ncbi:MAG: hypothetical protein ACD_20C00118G0025 [uncultured bacterium]|nr:MAG: hypothetical protein ACD_20C00118G0025 [uncultured bacterium]HBH18326.1 hypothetical protein [Cyanobacteria bacterium UBA9579]
MSENFQPLNLEEDAAVKFTNLCEIAKDIEINGQSGDQFPRQAVLSAVVSSDNEILYKRLEEALFDENQTEMMKTIVAGLFLTKGKSLALSEYTNQVLGESQVIGSNLENKESLLLVADALTEATKTDDEEIKNKCVNSLFKLYRASCNQDSTALIADQLLQRFMNILPGKSEIIDNTLESLVTDVNTDINSRLVAIDILTRSRPLEVFDTLQKLISDISKYSNNVAETAYLVDVITKSFYAIAVSELNVNYSSIQSTLNDMNLDEIFETTKDQCPNINPKFFDTISKRVKERIFELNEIINSKN